MSSAWAIIENEGEILIIRRSFEIGRPGQWCPPGGTMWRGERPDVAAVREAFEETGLRVAVQDGLAEFDGAHFFLCRLVSERSQLKLRPRECIDARWIAPAELLSVGTVMDLRKVAPVLELAGLKIANLPPTLNLALPTNYL